MKLEGEHPTYDGLSLAWSITEFIHNEPKLRARTIFATHYHELTNLEKKLDRLENHYVQVKEFKEKIIFLRSIVKGIGNRSYGIHVAKMAGLPRPVIDRANQILDTYMKKSFEKKLKQEMKNSTRKMIIRKNAKANKGKIDQIDINNTTPYQALGILSKLKKEMIFRF